MDLIAAYKRLRKEEEPLSCAAVVLGAGSAQRMGFDKMTAMLDGQPVLVRAINGKTRTESALAGVMALKKDCRLTAIHDGARPFVSKQLIEDCIRRASIQYAAIPVVKSTDTLRAVDENGSLIGTYDRDRVVRVQTPQIFLSEIIKGALSDAVQKGMTFTDDASAVERMGIRIQAVEGDEENIKLTTPQDMLIAQGILERRKSAAQ